MTKPVKIGIRLLVLGAAGMFLAFTVWNFHLDRKFIFFPEKEILGDPGRWGLSFEDVVFPSADGVKLHGWFIPFPGSGDTLLLFHGNAGNVSHHIENIKLLHDRLRINIFLFDYRGYGRSEGKISEEGAYRDAEGAHKYLLSRAGVSPSRIVFFGLSLGTAIAVQLALTHPPAAMILESPFTSIKDMAKRSFLLGLLTPFIRTRFDTARKLSRIHVPVLIIQGDQDQTVPPSMARRLYNLANGPREFYGIPGAGHNDTYIIGGKTYFETLARFISSSLQRRDSLRTAGRELAP